MTRIPIDGGWTLHPLAGPLPHDLPEVIPASVPGTVHTDLLAAGHIPDPYLDLNEDAVQWIGESDFGYRSTFSYVGGPVRSPDAGAGATGSGQHERVDLVCEGLDTVATIRLNDAELGRTRNQHRSYRFDVRPHLQEGVNTLEVDFASAVGYAREAEQRIGPKPVVGNALPYNAIRKMACNFGWDWGPVLVTAGIWKPIYLHAWSVARLAQVVPQVSVDSSGRGRVELRVDLERTSGSDVDLQARITGPGGTDVRVQATTSSPSVQLTFEVDEPQLWWPRGYGRQPLYEVSVSVSQGGEELDTWSHDVGFRTVEVRMAPDEVGVSFEFHVNGQYVFVKGANWIPDDCFLPRVTRERYASSIRDATEAGMNLLRIWGGGIFESDHLYDICNREGVLVWQDFLFACAAYSEAAELWEEVEAEARENVARLAGHPSLVYYNGSNENVEGYFHWGWKDRLGEGEEWGLGYYEKLLPQVLADVDPGRAAAYLPSSPFSTRDLADPRSPDDGPVHSWRVWAGDVDYVHYRDTAPRFVAEFGYQGPPNYATLTRAVHDEPMRPDSPGVLSHQKATDGNQKLARGYAAHLPEPTSFDDWHFTTQLNQARAIRYGIEHFRSHSPRTAGSVIWQLNDCWPVTSWAAVDGDKRRKPLWYALRSVNASRLLTLQPRDLGAATGTEADRPALVASNDTAKSWTGTVDVRRLSLDGRVLASQPVTLDVPPRSNQTVPLTAEVTAADHPNAEVLVASAEAVRRAYWYFVEDLALAVPALDLLTSVERTSEGYAVTVTAQAFVLDLVLNPDRLDPDARVDEMFLTLLPGESARLTVRTDRDLDEAALVSHPVLHSVNLLAHPTPNTRTI